MPDKNGWTRVEDGLPKIRAKVWLWDDCLGRAIPGAEWNGYWWNFPGGQMDKNEPSHWQPQQYPEPPEDE